MKPQPAPVAGVATGPLATTGVDPSVVAAHGVAEQRALAGETDALNGIADRIQASNRANGLKPAKP